MGEVKKHQNNHNSPKNQPNSPKNPQKSPQNRFLLCVTIIPNWGEPFQVFESSQYLSSGQSYQNSPKNLQKSSKIPQKPSKIPQKYVPTMCHINSWLRRTISSLGIISISQFWPGLWPPLGLKPQKPKMGPKMAKMVGTNWHTHFFGVFIP